MLFRAVFRSSRRFSVDDLIIFNKLLPLENIWTMRVILLACLTYDRVEVFLISSSLPSEDYVLRQPRQLLTTSLVVDILFPAVQRRFGASFSTYVNNRNHVLYIILPIGLLCCNIISVRVTISEFIYYEVYSLFLVEISEHWRSFCTDHSMLNILTS